MAKAPTDGRSARRLDGWARLAHAEWAAARASFEAALDREETPEALEGLSWAAWWLDDAGVVLDARERAYHLYRLGGERTGAARMATWLAADQLDFRGAAAVAGGWLRRARRLLDGMETRPSTAGWPSTRVAHLAGETARAAELGDRAAQVGRQLDVPDLEMLGLSLRGTTLVACAEVEEGMRCLDEAKAMAGEATIPISGAWACCFLVSACTAVLDHERALECCDSIAEFAERYGSRYILAFCQAEYGAIHLWRGQWTKAEEMFEAARRSCRAPPAARSRNSACATSRPASGDLRSLTADAGGASREPRCRAPSVGAWPVDDAVGLLDAERTRHLGGALGGR